MASDKASTPIPTLWYLLTKLRSASIQPAYHRLGIPQIMMLIAIFLLPFLGGDLRLSGFGASGIQFDYTDLLAIPLLLYLGISGHHRNRFLKMPYLHLWIAYGIILSISYIHAHIGEERFLTPLHVTYQLYRYCWKPLLLYPLIFILFPDKYHVKVVLFVLILMADISAAIAVKEGYGGLKSTGPFSTKNQLGGFLIIPLSLTLAMSLNSYSLNERIFYGLSFLVLLRALLFTRSKGAVGAFFISLACLGLVMSFSSKTRKRLPLLILGIFGGLVTLLLLILLFNKGVSLKAYTALLALTEHHNITWRLKNAGPTF